MRVTINAVEISPDVIAPPLNYGQLHRWAEYLEVRYEFLVSAPEFMEKVNPWFEQYRRDIRKDDVIDPPEAGSVDSELARLNYPSLGELLENHGEMFCQFMLEFPLEINQAFAPAGITLLRYAACSVDQFAIDGGSVRFGGIAFDIISSSD